MDIYNVLFDTTADEIDKGDVISVTVRDGEDFYEDIVNVADVNVRADFIVEISGFSQVTNENVTHEFPDSQFITVLGG